MINNFRPTEEGVNSSVTIFQPPEQKGSSSVVSSPRILFVALRKCNILFSQASMYYLQTVFANSENVKVDRDFKKTLGSLINAHNILCRVESDILLCFKSGSVGKDDMQLLHLKLISVREARLRANEAAKRLIEIGDVPERLDELGVMKNEI